MSAVETYILNPVLKFTLQYAADKLLSDKLIRALEKTVVEWISDLSLHLSAVERNSILAGFRPRKGFELRKDSACWVNIYELLADHSAPSEDAWFLALQ